MDNNRTIWSNLGLWEMCMKFTDVFALINTLYYKANS